MNQQINVVTKLYIFSFFVFISCATNTVSVPDWTTDVFSAYPNDKYIAQKGYGKNQREAENTAIGSISKIFSMHIETQDTQKILVNSDGTSSDTIDSQTFVKSQTDLFAVHYSEAYYNASQNNWEIVAYIDRDEAWTIYEPGLRQKCETFTKLFDLAENEPEPLKQTILYAISLEQARKNDVERSLGFAEILYPQKATIYSDVRRNLSNLPSVMTSSASVSSLYIECDNDFEGMVTSAATRVFSSQYIPVQKGKDTAKYLCIISIEPNERKSDAGTFFTPVLTINLTGEDRTIASYSSTIKRTGASNAEVAKKRAYTALVEDIEHSFIQVLYKDYREN
jgi:hypothetical protein